MYEQIKLLKEKKLLLVLYSGTQSIESQFGLDEWDIISVELNDIFTKPPYNLVQWTISVGDLTVKKILKRTGGRVPDAIWVSPVCTSDTIAAIGTHRTYVGGHGKTETAKDYTHTLVAKSEEAKMYDELLLNVLLLVRDLKPKLYYFENPRGGMRYKPTMIGLMYRYTVTYCSYGDTSNKPTDIWTNHPQPDFKPMCPSKRKGVINNCHHAKAPRGSKTEGSTQGKKGNMERSRIPKELCKHIATITNKYIDYMKGY